MNRAWQKEVEARFIPPEIKGCPFCGTPATMTYNNGSDTFNFACPSCHLKAGFGYGSASIHYGSKERARRAAINAWNRRVDNAED